MIGFGAVASLAKAAGISSVQPTPSIALGAYDATPLDMAGAYTVFANQGTRVSARMVASVHAAEGGVINNRLIISSQSFGGSTGRSTEGRRSACRRGSSSRRSTPICFRD